jgi:hypothetical protein
MDMSWNLKKNEKERNNYWKFEGWKEMVIWEQQRAGRVVEIDGIFEMHKKLTATSSVSIHQLRNG